MLKKGKNKERKRSGTRDIITGGVTAIVGIGLLGATIGAVNRV